jgi:hypothetical protein
MAWISRTRPACLHHPSPLGVQPPVETLEVLLGEDLGLPVPGEGERLFRVEPDLAQGLQVVPLGGHEVVVAVFLEDGDASRLGGGHRVQGGLEDEAEDGLGKPLGHQGLVNPEEVLAEGTPAGLPLLGQEALPKVQAEGQNLQDLPSRAGHGHQGPLGGGLPSGGGRHRPPRLGQGRLQGEGSPWGKARMKAALAQ